MINAELRRSLEERIAVVEAEIRTWEKGHAKQHELELAIHNTERDANREAIATLVEEIGRRLELLNNHSAAISEQQEENVANLAKQQATYVTQIEHDALVNDVNRRFSEVAKCSDMDILTAKGDMRDKELERLRLLEANIRGQIVAYSAVASLIVGILFFIAGKLW